LKQQRQKCAVAIVVTVISSHRHLNHRCHRHAIVAAITIVSTVRIAIMPLFELKEIFTWYAHRKALKLRQTSKTYPIVGLHFESVPFPLEPP
jgi:hypothetical protein